MTTEGVAETEQNVELDSDQEAAEDAAFEAAFNAARGIEPGAESMTSENDANPEGDDDSEEKPQDDEAAAAAAAEAEAAKKAAEAEAAANAPVTITKADYDRLMTIANEVPTLREQITKTHDRTFGRLGELQQTINALKTKADTGNKASIKQLKRLEAEFPELANLLKEDLSDVFGASEDASEEDKQSASPAAPAQVNPLEHEEVQKVLREKEMQIVEAVHPGFLDLASTPEFAEWTATLPAEAVNLLRSSWDSKVMVPAFNDFKKWKEQRVAAKSAKQQNDKRLERAITATDGNGASAKHVVDEDAAFEAGFNTVRNGGR